MSTTTPCGVLSSLLAEDRPWTVDELVREKGDRLSVEDALSELDALGLLTRINKRVVCASRTAVHADRMEDE
jgi:predicted transcriptional regulator